jgi:4-hydroxy-tetrahydrodipicolinate synthase
MLGNVRAITGVGHIALTPFGGDGTIDERGIANIVAVAVEAGCSAVIPLGIMGEAHKLIEGERDVVLSRYVAEAGADLHVIAGVSAESTIQAIDRARRAQQLGATAMMMAPPRGSAPGPELLAHYAAVAEAVPLPLVVQDEPVTTGVRLPASFFGQLATIDTVFAAKVEEAPSPPKIAAIGAAAPELSLFGGLGGISLYEELGRGASGIMTGFGFPHILADICRLFREGDREVARAVFFEYLPIIRFEAQLGVGGVAIRKRLFFERGLIATPDARGPSPALDSETVRELNELIEVLDLGRHDA